MMHPDFLSPRDEDDRPKQKVNELSILFDLARVI